MLKIGKTSLKPQLNCGKLKICFKSLGNFRTIRPYVLLLFRMHAMRGLY